MDEKRRKALIPELDTLADKAKELTRDIDHLMSRHNLSKNDPVILASNQSYHSLNALRAASESLKKSPEGIAYIQAAMIDWYHFHYELEEIDAGKKLDDPTFESVTYKGKNEWEIIMQSTTDGRQKAIVQSDAASWDQVYSVEKDENHDHVRNL